MTTLALTLETGLACLPCVTLPDHVLFLPQFEDRKTQQAFADQHRTPTFSLETMTPWTTIDNHGKKRYAVNQAAMSNDNSHIN